MTVKEFEKRVKSPDADKQSSALFFIKNFSQNMDDRPSESPVDVWGNILYICNQTNTSKIEVLRAIFKTYKSILCNQEAFDMPDSW